MRHWEVTGLATAGALAAWTSAGGTAWAVVALVAAGATAGLVVWPRPEPERGRARWWPMLLAVTGVLGALGALVAARRIRAVETNWPAEREAMVEDARDRLDATLGEAVDLARGLAARSAGAASVSPSEQFVVLAAEIRPGAPEHGVVLFDDTGRPRAWAGRHRVPVTLPRDELDAFMTPFYAVLTARRQHGPWTAASQVLLAADSAVPDREQSVAARFARRTGVGLEFFVPGTARALWTDLFDYCQPECRAPGADTLFSVRAVPPAQGERKLQLVAGGQRRTAIAATLAFVLIAVAGGAMARYGAVGGVVGTYLFTPAGEHLGLGDAFSAATYFFEALGPLSASAGALFLSAALATVAAAGLWRWGFGRRRLGEVVAVALVLAVPYALASLARGITQPGEGVSLALWLSWQVTIAVAAGALLLLASALVRAPGVPDAPRWTMWAAGVWVAVLAIAGLLLWSPPRGWPPWFVYLWVPALLLAVRPASLARSAATIAVVAGSAAALLAWGATVEGRVALAERDLARIEGSEEPVTAGLLERFGDTLAAFPMARSEAALYREWRRSPFVVPAGDQPAVLAAWDSAGALVARLDLAELDLSTPLLQALARSAASARTPRVEHLHRVPGVHYVLAVPYADGSVVTVGVGPRSRAFPPVRVARFLRGERVLPAPYEIAVSEPISRPLSDSPSWRREAWVARSERSLEAPAGLRHVHLRVGLGSPTQLLVRGILAVLVDVALISVLWLWGYLLAGGAAPALAIRPRWPRSYRGQLTLVLSVFFVAPTVGFAAWSIVRVQAEADGGAQLLTRQTLRDAAVATRDLGPEFGGPRADRLRDLGSRFGADLLVYESGVLTASSTPVLQQLGLVDPYLPPVAYRHLLIEDDLETALEAAIGGRSTQVAYRNIGTWRGQPVVLGSPRLVDDAELLARRQDLALTLALVTLGGLAAAAWLAALAARALAKPVHALRAAAVSIGQGEVVPPRDPAVPAEFVPVVEGLERMAHDVRASQAALEAARQRTAAVLRSVATGVIALDRHLKVAMANPRAEELLGVPLREGTDARDLTGDDWQSLWEWVEAYATGGAEPEAHELVVDERRIRAQVAALGGDGGCVVALDDTTDLARAVRVLAWGELARQVAHEIKNPLTPLRLGIQHLERAYKDRRDDYGETLRRTARQILAEIERLDSIARAFARFGAPPAEAGPLARENLAEAARETAQLYALGAGAGVQVEGPASVYARVRRDEFKEVLVNLVENARTAGASMVRIVVQSADGGARVEVRDDGKGILPQDLPKIFEPQFSTTTSGAGLGLAICKRLVESWGGVIQVTSEVGQGTTVTIVTAG
jgi:signal transduction histidine kinase